MSPSTRMRPTDYRTHAPIFAALGDETRLMLLGRLGGGESRSITQLAEGSPLSRQAITKHLRVLAGAGLVRSRRSGRESLFALDPRPIEKARSYLELVSRQWDETLVRLKAFVEQQP